MADAEDDEHGNSDRRDPDQMKREAQRAARVVTAQRVLDAADIRDVEADARDRIAVEGDRAVLSEGADPDAPEPAEPVDIGLVDNEPVENEPAENASTKNPPGEHRP